MSACRSCGAEILWVSTEAKHKSMPLDAAPNENGNVILHSGRACVLGPLELALLDESDVRYMPHHATCPDAASWLTGGQR